MTNKAAGDDFKGRFREIISDPLNFLISRHPLAGFVEDGYIYLHNGIKVPIMGPNRYYGDFSDVLIYNRGVHEPLEEFIFQQLLTRLPSSPIMLELGAYWGHYSMWLKRSRPLSHVHLVEPDLININVGKSNFNANGITGNFVSAFVGRGQFTVDDYMSKSNISIINVLHVDIQGYELEMLEGCLHALRNRLIDYIFISTHSQHLHARASEMLSQQGYKVEVSSDFDQESTSFDGILFASSPRTGKLFSGFRPLGRIQIASATPCEIVNYLNSVSVCTLLP